eukprot:m.122055 g.122055  ORF g.122055 m.122055 type:complete len:138 (+) comp14415_c0_seq3:1920-2333(+)
MQELRRPQDEIMINPGLQPVRSIWKQTLEKDANLLYWTHKHERLLLVKYWIHFEGNKNQLVHLEGNKNQNTKMLTETRTVTVKQFGNSFGQRILNFCNLEKSIQYICNPIKQIFLFLKKIKGFNDYNDDCTLDFAIF